MEFSARYVNRDAARRRYGALADTYAGYHLVGDPLADEAAAVLASMPRAAAYDALARALEGARDVPEPLLRLIDSARERPAWVDAGRLDAGAIVYQRIGALGFMVLSAWSLMNGYHSGPAVKPLMFTGQLDRMASRRLAETARFVTEVAQTGAMRPGGPGVALTIRVRVMHAMVRQMLAGEADWDTGAWGVPINQGDMVGTIVEFSLLVLRGAEQLGFVFEPRESEDLLHLWRYVGHVIGVAPRLLEELSSYERGVRFAYLVRDVQPGPDADSLALAKALRATWVDDAGRPLERLGGALLQRYHDGLTWAFNGEAVARGLHIPNRSWRHAAVPTRIAVRTLEAARRRLPGATWLAAFVGNQMVRRRVSGMLGGTDPDYQARRVRG